MANGCYCCWLQDPDGVIAQREAHRSQGGGGGPPGGMGGGMGMGPGPGAPPMVNIPPSLLNNPNIPNEIIHGLQAGKIGSTVFVANVSCIYAIEGRPTSDQKYFI